MWRERCGLTEMGARKRARACDPTWPHAPGGPQLGPLCFLIWAVLSQAVLLGASITSLFSSPECSGHSLLTASCPVEGLPSGTCPGRWALFLLICGQLCPCAWSPFIRLHSLRHRYLLIDLSRDRHLYFDFTGESSQPRAAGPSFPPP